MSNPANYNLSIYQGDTFVKDFQLIQNIGGVDQDIDLSELTLLGQVRLTPENEAVIAEFSIEKTTPLEGKFRISMQNVDTRELPRVSFYDIQSVDDATGAVKTWIAGKINSTREVTRDYEDGE